MCLCAFHFVKKRENSYFSGKKLILVFNRDEFYSRPTEPLHKWESSLFGGQDREPGREGGSWLVLSEEGKLAALTNHLTPNMKSNVRSSIRPRSEG